MSSSAPISTETTPSAETVSNTTKNQEMIEKLYEDSKNTLKNEYDTMMNRIKEDLNRSRQQAIVRLKKI